MQVGVEDVLAEKDSALEKVEVWVRWIQKGFKGGFLQKRLNPIWGPFLGDSVRILGVCPAVSPTFGP